MKDDRRSTDFLSFRHHGVSNVGSPLSDLSEECDRFLVGYCNTIFMESGFKCSIDTDGPNYRSAYVTLADP